MTTKPFLLGAACALGMLFGTGVPAAETAETAEKAPPIHVWPRNDSVNLPTQLAQFFFLEVPAPAAGTAQELRMTLPEGMKVVNFPTATRTMVLPRKDLCIFPEKWQQNGQTVTMTFPAAAAMKNSHAFLCLTLDVQSAPGKYEILAEQILNGKGQGEQKIPVQVHPALSGNQPKKMTFGVYDYNGYDPEFLPVYLNMMQKTGFNALYHMHGETWVKKDVQTAASISKQYGMRNAMVFFVSDVLTTYQWRPLPEAAKGADLSSFNKLLDQPEVFKALLKDWFAYAMAGKDYSCIVYDAEDGPFSRKGGDRSEYCKEQFRKAANIPAEEALTDEVLKTKYRKEWVAYQCGLTARCAKIIREVLDDAYPEFRFEIYSGYEIDHGPNKDRTRERYAVDWKKMADSGLDYATAGYFGSADQLRNTADAVKGKAKFIPAEMYLEGYSYRSRFSRNSGSWSVRLIKSVLHSGRQGLLIWYGNILDGNAMIAIDRVASVLCKVEDILMQGTPAPDSIAVRPEAERDNVYVVRRDGDSLIFLMNPDAEDKTITVTLKDFKITGFTGTIGISDVMTGEKFPAEKVQRFQVPAKSFRTIQLFEDGN